MLLGAHIHQAEIQAPISTSSPSFALPLILTPSVSPIYFTNPGYTIMDLEKSDSGKWESNMVNWRFF
jgi:hypothetical protein